MGKEIRSLVILWIIPNFFINQWLFRFFEGIVNYICYNVILFKRLKILIWNEQLISRCYLIFTFLMWENVRCNWTAARIFAADRKHWWSDLQIFFTISNLNLYSLIFSFPVVRNPLILWCLDTLMWLKLFINIWISIELLNYTKRMFVVYR